jgi:hypothetical protein
MEDYKNMLDDAVSDVIKEDALLKHVLASQIGSLEQPDDQKIKDTYKKIRLCTNLPKLLLKQGSQFRS